METTETMTRNERTRPKRASRRSLRVAAAGAAAAAFALPWAALKAVPKPAGPPAQIVVVQGGKVVTGSVAHGGQPSVTTTRASGAPPIH